MLYLGSDNELPLVKLQKCAFLCVKNAQNMQHLTKKFQYYIGSYQGCGCGFWYEAAEDIDDISTQFENNRRSVAALFEYIQKYVEANQCELFTTWADDEDKDITHREVIRISEFDFKESFHYPYWDYALTNRYVTIYK